MKEKRLSLSLFSMKFNKEVSINPSQNFDFYKEKYLRDLPKFFLSNNIFLKSIYASFKPAKRSKLHLSISKNSIKLSDLI